MRKRLAIILMALPPLALAEVYRWVDEQGVTNFSNERPDSLEIMPPQQRLSDTFVSPTIGMQARPSASRQVAMYSAVRCKTCDEARKYFQASRIEFVEYDIERSDESRRAFENLGGISVPLILVDGKPLNGFSIPAFSQAYQ